MKVANRIPRNSLAAGLERNDLYRKRRTECPNGGPSEEKGFDRVMVDVECHIWKELRIYVLKASQMRNKAITSQGKAKGYRKRYVIIVVLLGSATDGIT